MKQSIFEQIEDELNETSKDIKLTDKVTHNYSETIGRIIAYDNNQFYEGGQYDEEGYKKYFFNVSYHRIKNATKEIDFDVSNIDFLNEKGQAYYPVWILEKQFRQWTKKKRFGKFLNKIIQELPEMGSVVIKNAKAENMEDNVVDLRNFFPEPSAYSLQEARFIIERHYYTPYELLKYKDKWDNVRDTIASYQFGEDDYIPVFERHGYVPKQWIDEKADDTDYTYAKHIVYIGHIRDDKGNIQRAEKILFVDEVDEAPYWEVHFERIKGRWLGRGFVEQLFESQAKKNEIENLASKGLWWSSLNIYQSADPNVERNLLEDARNGDIIPSRDGISPIVNEERNLSAYNNADMKWDQLMDYMTFSSAPMMGQQTKSGVPLGTTAMQQRMAQSFFDYVRENIAFFIKGLIWDYIIPSFKEEHKKSHLVNLLGTAPEEMSKIQKLRKTYEYNRRVLDYVSSNNDIPSQDEAYALRAALTAGIEEENEKFVEVPDNFYEDLEFDINVNIVGETIDVAAKQSTLQTAFQIINNNPAVLKDPQSKKLFYKMLDLSGIDPAEFEVQAEDESASEDLLRAGGLARGGSVSAPTQRGAGGAPPQGQRRQRV